MISDGYSIVQESRLRRWAIDDKYQATIKSLAVHRYQSEVETSGNYQSEIEHLARTAV